MDMEHYAVADGLAPIAASTPWSPAPRGEQLGLLAAWGGGAADDAGALLVWRCAGDVLVLGELALAADDEDVAPPCVALRLASPAPARGDACCRVAPPGAEKNAHAVDHCGSKLTARCPRRCRPGAAPAAPSRSP